MLLLLLLLPDDDFLSLCEQRKSFLTKTTAKIFILDILDCFGLDWLQLATATHGMSLLLLLLSPLCPFAPFAATTLATFAFSIFIFLPVFAREL